MSDWREDARIFGLIVRGGNWEAGLRVARCVELKKGAGTRTDLGRDLCSLERPGDRVSIKAFARESGTGCNTVRFYFQAWELAADAGLVPRSADLTAESNYDFEALGLDQDEWDSFYDRSPGVMRKRNAAAKRKKAREPDDDLVPGGNEDDDLDDVELPPVVIEREDIPDDGFSLVLKVGIATGNVTKTLQELSRVLNEIEITEDIQAITNAALVEYRGYLDAIEGAVHGGAPTGGLRVVSGGKS